MNTLTLFPLAASAEDAELTFGERASQMLSDLRWFFGNLTPTALWSAPALAACIGLVAYFWYVSAPKKRSLEWIAMVESRPKHMTLVLPLHPFEAKKDVLPMLLLTALYAFTAFFRLGNTHSPQSYAVFQQDTSVTFSFGQTVEVDKLSYFPLLGTGTYTLEYSADGVNWNSLTLEQHYNTIFKWEVRDLTQGSDDFAATGAISGKVFRLTASSVERAEGLWLGELALWSGGAPLTPAEVDQGGAALFDEPREWASKQTYLNSSYFDEIYHPRTALEHLNNVYPYEVSHPPLGKLILSLGILMFGLTPFGWRFMGTLFGVLMLPVLYLFLKNLFGKTPVALCGTALFAFDFMHLVQTRIATIDTYAVFFILVSYYFMYRWLATPIDAPLKKAILPLGLCGLAWGIGCACKWTVIYAGVGLALLWLLNMFFKRREWRDAYVLNRKNRKRDPRIPELFSFGKYLGLTTGLSVVFFVAVPVTIYTLSYIPYATATAEGLTPGNLLHVMWDNQQFMLRYHMGVNSEHPYQSYWYQWLLDARPILYYRDLDLADSQGIKSLFAAFDNPLVSWAGLLAAVSMGVEAARQKSGKALFILIAILSQFVPWLGIGRTLFAYHYFPTVLFLCFAIAYLLDRILERGRKGAKLVVYGFTGYATALYAVFYPALTGIYMPLWYAENFLRWFPTWPL